jgi:hypothetical protein
MALFTEVPTGSLLGRDMRARVGARNKENHPGAVRTVLTGHPLRPPANGAEHGDRPAGGVVSQNPPDLL